MKLILGLVAIGAVAEAISVGMQPALIGRIVGADCIEFLLCISSLKYSVEEFPHLKQPHLFYADVHFLQRCCNVLVGVDIDLAAKVVLDGKELKCRLRMKDWCWSDAHWLACLELMIKLNPSNCHSQPRLGHGDTVSDIDVRRAEGKQLLGPRRIDE